MNKNEVEMIYALIKMFGERYIYCDDFQVVLDTAPANREAMVQAFSGIIDYIDTKIK